MLSTTAQKVYRWAARISILFFVLLVAAPFLSGMPQVLVPLYRAVLFLGVVATALLVVAMEYFLFGFDQSSSITKAFWIVLAFVPPLGTALYCLYGYARSEILDKPVSNRPEGMAEEFRGFQ
ncbi:MAG TPA: hypothetical protein VHD85_02520 [Terracidiphilus sp.]|nr:hypothetical protein [Terracidiphilus sp.]